MKKLTFISLLILTLTLAACGGAAPTATPTPEPPPPPTSTPVPPAPEIVVEEAWGRASPMMADAGAIYMHIHNEGDAADTLISAATDACGVVELHETYDKGDGTMGMRPVEGGIEIPADEAVALEPGGLHIMCLQKKADFAVGATVALTLTFEKFGEVTVEAEVREMEEGMMPMSPIAIEEAWGRASPMMADAGAFYMNIHNSGHDADTLISAATGACGVVELHETYDKGDGTMGMRPVEGGIEIPADEAVALEPGGLHIMCLQKKADFAVGAKIMLTLNFEHAGEVMVEAEVRDQ